MPGILGSVLGLVGPVSVYCDWVRWKVWSATSISVWQHVKLSEQIRLWDTLACCWEVKPPTNKTLFSLTMAVYNIERNALWAAVVHSRCETVSVSMGLSCPVCWGSTTTLDQHHSGNKPSLFFLPKRFEYSSSGKTLAWHNTSILCEYIERGRLHWVEVVSRTCTSVYGQCNNTFIAVWSSGATTSVLVFSILDWFGPAVLWCWFLGVQWIQAPPFPLVLSPVYLNKCSVCVCFHACPHNQFVRESKRERVHVSVWASVCMYVVCYIIHKCPQISTCCWLHLNADCSGFCVFRQVRNIG